MTTRGETTRRRLIDATTVLVGQVGYANVTTRGIAKAAGVAEGTLYRHFPDKTALFFAAVIDRNASILAASTTLPDQAGTGTVADNLVVVLRTIAGLQQDMVPLELAVSADPTLARARQGLPVPLTDGPPQHIARYLQAEQALGRVRDDCDPVAATVALLAMLFGLAINPATRGSVAESPLLGTSVRMFVTGIASAGE
jgi:AcrR family transcriptional regulator